MFVRTLTAFALVASISAWPILFFPTQDCQSEPVFVLHEEPRPGKCGYFPDVVKSYSGGTEDGVQKLLIYYHEYLCGADAAHRMHSNHTINNSTNECVPFKKRNETPTAYTFIEEILPPPTNFSSDATCNALRVQTS